MRLIRNIHNIISLITVLFAFLPYTITHANVLRTSSDSIITLFDGGKEQLRRFIPSNEPEIITTTANEVSFLSDIDTVTINLNDWDTATLKILTTNNDSAFIHLYRRAINPYNNPPKNIITLSSSGHLSKQQAIFDIEALIDGISNVHPDMFSVCRSSDFFKAVNKLKSTLPDSISITNLYIGLTKIVSMLGDGHTHLLLPSEMIFNDANSFMPLNISINTDKSLKVIWCLDNAIPTDSKIISINGITADSLINNMLHLVSGERDHFKLMRLDTDFTGLFNILHPAEKYDITYSIDNSPALHTISLYPEKWNKIKSIFNKDQDTGEDENIPYSYTIDSEQNIAIMDFKSSSDENRMKIFADSMFQNLQNKKIKNLIIDLRENGGGNSLVGDILLRHICPESFTQMDKILYRITPLTARLLNARNITSEFNLIEIPESDYIKPLSTDNGFFNGNIYLLTSHKTFSAAASFAWIFSQCNIGMIIGEETGGMNVSFGDKVWYQLPVSGLKCGISFKRFWQFRADESSIHGTFPDIPVSAQDALQTAKSLIKLNNHQ